MTVDDLRKVFGEGNVIELPMKEYYVPVEIPKPSPEVSEELESSSQTDPDPSQK